MYNKHYDNWMDLVLDTTIKEVKQEDQYFWYTFQDTIFYVEGGGMISDSGVINNQIVMEVKRENGEVWHCVEKELSNDIHMEVDRIQRKVKCQIHSASHLLNGIFDRIYHAPTMSFFTNDVESCEERAFEHLDDKIMNEIEAMCNDYIALDLPIKISYPTYDEAIQKVDIEKMEHDELRGIEIEGVEFDMCGCIHVPSLKYIQMIKLLRFEKTSRGYKIFYVCGDQLLKTYHRQYRLLSDNAKSLGVPQIELSQGIIKIQTENKSIKNELSDWKQKYVELLSDKIAHENPQDNIAYLFEDIDIKTFQSLCSYFVRTYKKGIFFMCHDLDRCHVMISHHKELEFECNTLFKEVSLKFELRGGGNKMMAQGGGLYQESIFDYIQELCGNQNSK